MRDRVADNGDKILSKSATKIVPKSDEKPPKIHPKSVQNRSRGRSGSPRGARTRKSMIWRVPRGGPERPRGRPGASKNVFRTARERPGRPRRAPGTLQSGPGSAQKRSPDHFFTNFGRKPRSKQFSVDFFTILRRKRVFNFIRILQQSLRTTLAKSSIVHLAGTAFCTVKTNTKRMFAKNQHGRSEAKKRAKTLRKTASKQ